MKNRFEMKKGVYRFKIKNGKSAPKEEKKTVNFPKNEYEENDINLMMIFGMEKEARNKNPEKYNKVKRDSENSSVANGKQEYLSSNQNDEFCAGYLKKYKGVKLKIAAAFLLFVASIVFEYAVYYTGFIQNVILEYSPVVIGLGALQILVLCIALGYKQFFAGFGIAAEKRVAGVVFTVLSSSCFAYYLLLCYMLATGKAGMGNGKLDGLYLSLIAFCLLMSLFEELCHVKREWKSFLVVSKSGEKFVLDKNQRIGKRYTSAERKRSLSVKKTDFVSGFVGRCGQGIVKRGSFNCLVFIGTAASLALAVYRYIMVKDILNAFSVLMVSLLLTLPFSAFITYSLGYKKAVDKGYEKGSTVVGLRAFEEYQSSSAVYFDDLAVFPPSGIKLKGFKSYGNHRIDNSLYIIASIYDKIDAPPARMFKTSIGEGAVSDSVDIIHLSPSGIHAVVDGKSVYIGSGEYMNECGYTVPEGIERDAGPLVSVTYMAVSGSVAMKMYVEYRMDDKMMSYIEALRKYGIYLGIYTCDPNINDAMMNKRLPLARYPVGIVKSTEEKKRVRSRDDINSGLVSSKDTSSLLSALLLCINTSHSVKIDMIVKYFSLAAGLLIAFLVTFFGVEGHITSWFLILYQYFWLLPSFLIAAMGTRN